MVRVKGPQTCCPKKDEWLSENEQNHTIKKNCEFVRSCAKRTIWKKPQTSRQGEKRVQSVEFCAVWLLSNLLSSRCWCLNFLRLSGENKLDLTVGGFFAPRRIMDVTKQFSKFVQNEPSAAIKLPRDRDLLSARCATCNGEWVTSEDGVSDWS